ncbi:hypothetical protein AnigIFM63309_006796 [Aspergillus niger]|nr:hypothetical protein AnigIFM63309_006796 [Aspergillus niger]
MPEGGDIVEGGEEDRLEGGEGETDEATVEIANVVKNQRLELRLPLLRPRRLLLALGKHDWTVLKLPRQRRVRRCCMLWVLKTLLVAEVKVVGSTTSEAERQTRHASCLILAKRAREQFETQQTDRATEECVT